MSNQTFGATLQALREQLANDRGTIVKREVDSDLSPLSQAEFAEWLTQETGTSVSSSLVSSWERERRSVAKQVQLEALITFFAQHGALSLAEANVWLSQQTRHQIEPKRLAGFFASDLFAIDYPYPSAEGQLSKPAYCRETEIAIYHKATLMARQQENQVSFVELAITLAQKYQQNSQLGRAIAVYQQIIPAAEQLTDQGYLAARAKSNLAYLYSEVDEALWKKGQRYCHEAIKTFTGLKRPDADDRLAHAYNHLGLLELRLGNGRQAQEHLIDARRLWEGRQEENNLVDIHINLGVCLLELEQYPQALDSFNTALTLTEHKSTLASIRLNQGIIYRRQRNFDKAVGEINKARVFFEANDNPAGLAKVNGNLGLVLLDQEVWDEARYHLDTSHQAWQALDNPFRVNQAAEGLDNWRQRVKKHIVSLGER